MRIRCERCATTYELDERKLPPHGGMVKCTRCQHVFRAAPPAAGPASPHPARGNGVDAAASEKTAVFGYAAGGEAEGTASLGSAAPATPARREEPSSPRPERGSAGASASAGAASPGGRRWVWALVGVAVAVALGLLFLMR